jgi:glutaminyl-tRNA synthetase
MPTPNEEPSPPTPEAATRHETTSFIRDIIEADLAEGRVQRVVTRFPPEPNGYLHIGHAKSICLNFGLARSFHGTCHLRLDDTNPTTEDVEYVESIQRDVRWLGFDWGDNLFYASDYYEKLYAFAETLIRAGKAYVCSLSEEEIRKYRGTAFEPGIPSPYRDRTPDENLDLFRRMRKGEFPDGAHVLRAKIDMASPNLKMRDWPLYRIRHEHHYRTGDTWCLYPLYDFAHCLSDLIEGISHSICTLEFENNRELYDWIVDAVTAADPRPRPHQYEFARLSLTYTLMSKRKLLDLVEGKVVSGWDDPRMPTIAGLRRRGYPPEAIREFCDRIGVAKNNSVVEHALLEHVVREDLNQRAPRVLAVLRPLRVVIENFPDGRVEHLDAPYFPADIGRAGSRVVPLSGEIYIDRDDYLESPPKDFHRLAPGREVRLRHAYVIRCTGVLKDPVTGEVTQLVATYDPTSRGSDPASGRKVKGTIQWVSAAHALAAEVRLYDRLFTTEEPGSTGDVMAELNPSSLVVLKGCCVEPSLEAAKPGDRFQFERIGFFNVDPIDSKPGALVFNRTVALKDTWGKISATAVGKSEVTGGPGPTATSGTGGRAPEGKATPVQTLPLGPAAAELCEQHGLPTEDARILAGDPWLLALFEEALRSAGGRVRAARGQEALEIRVSPKAIARWVVNDVAHARKATQAAALDGRTLATLIALVEDDTISNTTAKEVLAELCEKGGSPRAIVERLGLVQISDEVAIEAAVDAVLADNAEAVGRYRAGNTNLLGAFVGMVMKKTGGKANPRVLNELLKKKLQ